MSANKVFFHGNLVADPELRTTTNGVSVTTFEIAVGRRFAKPEDEVKADFFKVVAWRGLAEHVAKHFHKGKPIIVIGSLQNRSYTNQEGQKRYVTEVIAEECDFAGNKEKSEGPNILSENTNFPIDFTEIGDDDDLPFN